MDRSKEVTSTETISYVPSEEELPILQARYNILNYPLDFLLQRLKETIIGQDECVKSILYAVYQNQYLNLLEDLGYLEMPARHLNVLAVGPSGVGKTKTVSSIAKLFHIPYVKFNATQLTATGMVGKDVEDILLALLEAANDDREAAQRGIIFIDEIDKKQNAKTITNTSGRDFGGLSVQEELLQLLESSVYYVGKDRLPFYTDRLTIVASGRFKGLEEIRKKRVVGTLKMGFQGSKDSDQEPVLGPYEPEDFIEFGFLDEFIGRFLVITEFKMLTLNDFVNIIYAKGSILQEYMAIFNACNVDVYIDPILFSNIAEEAMNSPTAVRAVERKVFHLIQPLLYQTLQHHISGICEIDANGNYSWIFDS